MLYSIAVVVFSFTQSFAYAGVTDAEIETILKAALLGIAKSEQPGFVGRRLK